MALRTASRMLVGFVVALTLLVGGMPAALGLAVPDVALTALPTQAQETYVLIRAGGPFPYERDGVVFGNREKILPLNPRGYYHEYTVRTPGARDRGARRIVCGGAKTAPDSCYYTDDHYQSFRRIRE